MLHDQLPIASSPLCRASEHRVRVFESLRRWAIVIDGSTNRFVNFFYGILLSRQAIFDSRVYLAQVMRAWPKRFESLDDYPQPALVTGWLAVSFFSPPYVWIC